MQYAMVTMQWALGEKLVNNFGINRIPLQTKVFILERNKLMQITVHEMVALGLRGSCLCLSIANLCLHKSSPHRYPPSVV